MIETYGQLFILAVPMVVWLVMFLGTRHILPVVRKLPDGAQMAIALVVSALVSSAATHYGVVLPDAGVISHDNLTLLILSFFSSMGIHTAVKPIEEATTVARFGPLEGFRDRPIHEA